MKRRLEGLVFVEHSQRGSHVKSVRRNGATIDTVIVPRKPEVPIGTLHSILNQAHVRPDEWDVLGR